MTDTCKICFLDEKGDPSEIFVFPDQNNKISIYSDDTVRIIKQKILYGIRTLKSDVSIDEMYLFIVVDKPFILLNWYKQITKNETIPLTKEYFCQLLLNFSVTEKSEDVEEDELASVLHTISQTDKSIVTYEEILEIPWFRDKKTVTQKIPLGFRMEYSLTEKKKRVLPIDELFSANPYDILPSINLLKLHENKEPIILDNEFLFHYGSSFKNNTIYVCTAANILKENIAKFYFPQLFKKGITTKDQLRFFKTQLDQDTRELIFDPANIHRYTANDIFYSVVREANQPFPYKKKGISLFALNIENSRFFQSSLRVPLESIFKNIHATKAVPYMGYYSGYKQDQVLRVYYEEEAQNGNKIPFLTKDVIMDIQKERHGSKPHIILYVACGGQKNDEFIQILLEQNGNIHLHGKLDPPLPYSEFEKWLREKTVSVFESINDYLIQSGYSIRGFDSLLDPYLTVSKLSYTCSLELTKQLNLNAHLKCLSSLFAVEPDKTDQKEFQYRYKRVEYFQAMNEEEEFISQLLKITQEQGLIEKQIKIRFPQYSSGEIRKLLVSYASKYRTIHGRFINRKTESLANAGFPIVFMNAMFGSSCTVEIAKIEMLEYVLLIEKYIDSILWLSQYPESVSPKWLDIWNETGAAKIENTKTSLLEQKDNIDEPKLFLEKEVVKEVDDYYEDDHDEEDDNNELDDYLALLDDNNITPSPTNETPTSDNVDEQKSSPPENDDNPEHDREDLIEEVNSVQVSPSMGSAEDSIQKPQEEDSEESNFSFSGGKKDTIRNYLTNRIKGKDPKLYETLEGYTKVCNENQKRQPVIITDKEKKLYEAKYKSGIKPFGKSLEYGKDENNEPLHYICPRYWCTKPGMEGPLTDKDVESGICGTIITNPSAPQENEYIYTRNYAKARFRGNPSFVKKKNTKGDDVCYPCCFQEWDDARAKECNPDVYDVDKKDKEEGDKKSEVKQMYVLGYNKLEPLTPGRHGFLPMPIQQFLNVDTNTCIDNNEFRTVKRDCPVLLRYGVENTQNNEQSFLACIADVYCFERNIKKTMDLTEFREKIADGLTLDVFVQFQNGALVSQFTNKKRKGTEINFKAYMDQKLYENIDKREESQINFLEHCILSYETFLDYLTNPAVKIDHTFLWDYVVKPNPNFFYSGVNLMILQMTQDDITNKVDLICPTNHYQSPLFDEKRPTILLLKSGNIYEPIYQVTRNSKTNVATYLKYFSKSNNIGDMGTILQMVQTLTESQCLPFSSKTTTYKFDTNILAIQCMQVLNELGLNAKDRVINFQGKIIALMIPYKKEKFYLPCFPSTDDKVNELTNLKWMDDGSLWNDYHSTVDFLKHVYNASDKKIPCKPKFRIVEDGMIVGLLTITNQFVQINPPIQNIEKEFQEMKSSNYILAEKEIMNTKDEEDNSMNKNVKFIYLENQFFNSFRTTMRILIQLYKNRKVVKKIHTLIQNKDMSLVKKGEKMQSYLRRMGKSHVSFHEYTEDVLLSLHEIFTCENSSENKSYCLTNAEKTSGELLIPSKHLLTGEDNESIYYTRLADELLRHRRVHLFMFYPEQYLNINDQDYQIAPNEFVASKTVLSLAYFNHLKPHSYKDYARNVPFENSDPSKPFNRKPVKWTEEFDQARN